MLAGYSLGKAFRPSTLSDERGDLDLQEMDKLENIQRYARMVSRGLRLFEDSSAGDPTGQARDDRPHGIPLPR